MKNASLKIILVTAGAILFNTIFWQEKIAINMVFFAAFILAALFYLYPASLKQPLMKWLLASNIITLAAIVIQNTFLSKLAFSITLLLIVVFTQYLHRSVWYAGGSAIMNYIGFIPNFFSNIKLMKTNKAKMSGLGKAIRFMAIPLLLLFVFYLIYNSANAVFQNVMNDVGLALQNFFTKIFSWFNWERMGFLLLGLFITGGLLLKSNITYFSDLDISKRNDLWRQKNDLNGWKETNWFALLSLLMGKFANGVMALRNEQITGIISLAMLNLLLLCINSIDIVCVWFGFSYKHDLNLSAYVHEGAGLLIFSIVLAMALLLFFFRGNLNFYKKNKWLKYGASAWLIQNAILVISVFIRDYYYIAHMGLAYKRIGVLFFLLLVIAGLITVFIKIQQRKTTYYLLRVNAWIAIILLVASSCIHWDEMIATYNLARKDTVQLDVNFLLSLSDKALPVLEKNIDVLEKYTIPNETSYRESQDPKTILALKRKDFFDEQKEYSWLSWNMADEYVMEQLGNKHLLSLK